MSRLSTASTCIRCLSPAPLPTRRPSPAPSPRCLLLGPSNSGKSIFQYALSPSIPHSTFIPPPTTTSEVTEIPITPATAIQFIDTAGSDRRQVRLHFLSRSPISILYFISIDTSDLVFALEELEYAAGYALSRASQVVYFGIVLNKADLLPPEQEARAKVGVRSALGTERVVIRLGKGRETRRERVEKVSLEVKQVMEQTVRKELCWEIVNDAGKGVSMIEERGVRVVVDALARANGIEIVKVGSMGRSKRSMRARKGLVTAGAMSPR